MHGHVRYSSGKCAAALHPKATIDNWSRDRRPKYTSCAVASTRLVLRWANKRTREILKNE